MKHISSKNMDIHEVQVGWSLATGSLLLGQSPMALLFFKKIMVVMGCWHPLEVVREHDMELEQSLCVLYFARQQCSVME